MKNVWYWFHIIYESCAAALLRWGYKNYVSFGLFFETKGVAWILNTHNGIGSIFFPRKFVFSKWYWMSIWISRLNSIPNYWNIQMQNLIEIRQRSSSLHWNRFVTYEKCNSFFFCISSTVNEPPITTAMAEGKNIGKICTKMKRTENHFVENYTRNIEHLAWGKT